MPKQEQQPTENLARLASELVVAFGVIALSGVT
jgi:hypothetical protein